MNRGVVVMVCRCDLKPEHNPWHCPNSRCGKCKQGGHWARYCTGEAEAVVKPKTEPVQSEPVQTEPDEASPVQLKKLEEPKTQVEVLPKEEDLDFGKELEVPEWGSAPVKLHRKPEYEKWKSAALAEECNRVGLKTGPTARAMVERLSTLWEKANKEAPPVDTSPPKKSKLPFLV